MTMTWSMLAIDEGALAVLAHAATARTTAIGTARRCRGMDRSIECARCRSASSPTCCSGVCPRKERAGGAAALAERVLAVRANERGGPARPLFPRTLLLAGRLGTVRHDALRDGGVERFVLVIAYDVVQLLSRLHPLE